MFYCHRVFVCLYFWMDLHETFTSGLDPAWIPLTFEVHLYARINFRGFLDIAGFWIFDEYKKIRVDQPNISTNW